jgi:hypothetical protein
VRRNRTKTESNHLAGVRQEMKKAREHAVAGRIISAPRRSVSDYSRSPPGWTILCAKSLCGRASGDREQTALQFIIGPTRCRLGPVALPQRSILVIHQVPTVL